MFKSSRGARALAFAVMLTSFAATFASTGAEEAKTSGGAAAGTYQSKRDTRTGAALTFAKPGGDTFFAISLAPNVARPAAAPRDVLVMFDTSASQAGEFREKALAALQSFLSSLDTNDRVKIAAIDLQTIELTNAFVAPASIEVQQALSKLRERVPLGSTDLELGLEAAATSFAQATAGHLRTAAYIGDGMSTARLIPNSRMQQLVDQLVSQQISVDSYAIGPRLDNLLLGALANHTGGMLLVDTDDWNAKQAGILLASTVKEPVLWPQQVQLPASLADAYPRRLPPLRFDRDTILIGRGKEQPSGSIQATTESNGQKMQMAWQLAPQMPSDDNAYLADLVASSQRDGGLGLPLVGTAGLIEMRRLVRVEGRTLVRLGQQAIATGAMDQAEILAAQALRLDSGDPEALAIRNAVAKARKVDSRAAGRDLKLVNFQQLGEPLPAPANAEAPAAASQGPPDGDFLNQVEEQNRVLAGALQAEVQNALNQSRSMMATSPEQAQNVLKLEWEKVRQAPELSPELRLQLVSQLETALRSASQQAVIVADRTLRQQEVRAESEAQQQLVRDLFAQEDKVTQLMERFNALMDEGRYLDARNAAVLARDNNPHRVGPQEAALTDAPIEAAQVDNIMFAYANRENHRTGFQSMMMSVQRSGVPLVDDPPVVYPDPEVWKLLTERREKYKNVDLARNNTAEVKIVKALDEMTELDNIQEMPLTDVIDYLKTKHDIEIQLDSKALEEAGVALDTPITRNLKNITLRSALRLMLRELDLTYVIRDEVLLITTTAQAETIMTTKVYPVADLVIPIRNQGMSGFGGLGGGGGGMGMGGGGMGGGGMGGGGMGGGGMGGGGGMFSIRDRP